MRTVRWLALTTALLCACSSTPTPDNDATPDGSDASMDLGVDSSTDRGPDIALDATSDARADASPTDAPPPDAPPADVVVDYGQCGRTVRLCLCGCAGDATCQQTCINADPDCGFCVYTAATRCCPAESMAFDTCVERSGCTTDACILAMCAMENAAFNTCFQRRQMTDSMCRMELGRCLGAEYPMVVCL